MVILATAVSAVLMAEIATEPSWAGSAQTGSAHAAEPTALGGFALGDGVEGLIDPGSGALSFALPVAGLAVNWDSRASGVDRAGLGGGWSIAGIAQVGTEGGVQVTPASGGSYPADASVPSGLSGYLPRDLVFAQHRKTLPGRADGRRGEQAISFELVELGGVRTYFSAEGDPVVRLDSNGNRLDWEWQPGHRLVRAIDQTGLVSVLDWSSDPARVEVTTGAGHAWGVTARIELDGGRLATVTDASGGRVHVGYTDAGLVERIGAASGANTEVSWQALDDGRVAVDRVRVVDAATGAELSARQWAASAGSMSGWPGRDAAWGGDPTSTAATGGIEDGYRATMSDGSTTIATAFDAAHRVLARDVSVTTRHGDLVVQRQAYTYPERDGGGAMPPQAGQPIAATVIHLDASGAQRTEQVKFDADELGRVTRQVAEDGTITEVRFDDVLAAGGPVPVGLPVVKRVTAPDGLVHETRHELNASRTAHVVTETYTGTVDDAALTRTGRVEFDVEPDGFVRQERRYPQGAGGTPVVTVHTKTTDLVAGIVTTTTTVAAGTPSAATSSQVLDLLHGGVVREQAPAAAPVTARYDQIGRVVEQTDAAGNATRFGYRTMQHDGENATVVTSPDGVVTTTTTDVLGRVVRVTDNISDGVATPGHVRVAESREYPEPGVIRVTDAWGATATSMHDLYGRTVRSVSHTGLTELRRYDDVANTVTTALTATGKPEDALSTSTTQLDARGQGTGTTGSRADGEPVPAQTTTFDGFGRVTDASDGARTRSTAFDEFGNPATTTIAPEGAGGGGSAPGIVTATREFDRFGASIVKTLSDERESRTGGVLTYDELGRARSRTDQAGGVRAQEYTVDGRVAVATTSYGQITRYEYAADTRALIGTETTSPIGATVSTGYDIDPVTGSLNGVFDPRDRAGTEIRYDHDAWGNITRTTYPDGNVIEHEYDEHGRLVATTDVSGNVTRYGHDQTGLVTSATQTDGAGDPLAEVRYRYDAYGRLIEQARSNGVTTTYAWTSANQIAGERAVRSDGTVVSARTYAYDHRGNLLSRTDTRPELETGAAETATTTTAYRYDGFDRLTGSSVHDGATVDAPVRTTTRYEPTVGGDIRAEHVTDASGTTTSRLFEYGPTGTLTSVATTHPNGTVTTRSQEYDAAGNLTLALDGTRYTYAASNRPVGETTPDGVTIRIGYWATGQRASRFRDGTTAGTVFHWDGATLINDTHTTHDATPGGEPAAAEASVTAAYLLGVGRHARTLGAEASTVFFETDQHGNVTELTDAAGAVTTSYRYTDYGVTTVHDLTTPAGRDASASERVETGDAERNPFQYAGEYTDSTGRQHLQARTYDPETMRLMSVDPEPKHNRYHYAALNPITFADPTGRITDLPAWAYAVLAGVGVGLSLVGVAAAGLGVATAVATAAPTLGAKVGLVATIAAATVDLGVTALTTAHHYQPEFLNPDVAFGLGVAGAMVGVLTAVAGLGVRAVNRLEIEAYIEEGALDAMAETIRRKEREIGEHAQAAYAGIGQNYELDDLVKNLHSNVREYTTVEIAGAGGATKMSWDTAAHNRELNLMLKPTNTSAQYTVEIDDALGDALRPIELAELYAPFVFPSVVRPLLRDKLAQLQPQIVAAYQNVYLPHTTLRDSAGVAYTDRYKYVKALFPRKKRKDGTLSSRSAPGFPSQRERTDLETIPEELLTDEW